VVLEASKALEAANARGDAQQIRTAMQALEAALRGQAQAARLWRRTEQRAKSASSEQSSKRLMLLKM
jgi:regulator of protease activity HflC (stomatin/prohibitin superfamily)